MPFQGKKNKYTCNLCRGSIITIDVDEGVTPFKLPCVIKECNGTMKSGFYPDRDLGEPTYEWRKPAKDKQMSPAMRDYIDKGGLELYPTKD